MTSGFRQVYAKQDTSVSQKCCKLDTNLTVTSSRIVSRCCRMERKNGSQTVFSVELYNNWKHSCGSLWQSLLSKIHRSTSWLSCSIRSAGLHTPGFKPGTWAVIWPDFLANIIWN